MSVLNKTSADREPNMFQRTPIQFDFGGLVSHMKVCSAFLIYAYESKEGRGKFIRRVNMQKSTTERDEIELGKDGIVTEIFMDPTGDHVIVVTSSENNYYLNRLSQTLKLLSKFTGKAITAVAWNTESVQLNTTGPIIVGTSKGLLFETVLNASDDSKFKFTSSSTEQYCKMLYDLGMKVEGITFDKVTTSRASVFVLVATASRLYQFFGPLASTMEGGSVFCTVFDQYKNIEDIKYIDLPGDSQNIQLHIYQQTPENPVLSFAWMASPGVLCGSIDHTVSKSADNIIHDHKLIPYSKGSTTSIADVPISIVLTQYHILMLFKNRLKVVCILNEEEVWEDKYEETERVSAMWKDPVKHFVFVLVNKGVYRYRITNESRNIWKILLELKEYEKARACCSSDSEKLDWISREQAHSLFNSGKYDESAIFYAQTKMSFEEVTLKFIDAKKDVALRSYLEKKLLSYKSAEDSVQMTLLVTWLVELWLNQLGKISDQIESDGHTNLTQEKGFLQEEFRLFLAKKDIRECLKKNKHIVYSLIASHGEMDDLIFFAELVEDHEKVIAHRIQNRQYLQAIEQLQKVGEKDSSLVYKFSPNLMQHAPQATVDMWKTIATSSNAMQRPPLDPKKLIPALVQYDVKKLKPGQTHEAIRFLEFCIRTLKNKDQAIHNYLLSLYADFDHEQLLKYLKVQGQEAQSVNYDLKYALRLCSEKGLTKACVHIYSTMELYSEAVSLALTVDFGLARENAKKPEDSDERKKLWLQVARHVVEQQKDIDNAMRVLKDCDVLNIEDILPFFPDFVTIDKFKEAIIESLTSYNKHIDTLKEGMNEATKSAEEIRNKIQEFRKKSGCVKTTDNCAICTDPLLMKPFYLFPCQHKFHSECLIDEILKSKSVNVSQIKVLQKKVAAADDSYSIKSASSMALSHISPKKELDDLVTSECIYCGDAIIRTIDEPFITDDQYKTLDDWM